MYVSKDYVVRLCRTYLVDPYHHHLKKMDVESDPATTFTVADSGIDMKLKHLIALKLFIGDYRFGKLQRKLIDSIRPPNCKTRLRSLLHWKTALEDGLWRIKAIRSSLKLKGDIVFTRDMSMECVLESVFGHWRAADAVSPKN